MISTIAGVLAGKGPDSVIIQTDGGVGYALTVPLGVFERLPAEGKRVSLYAELVVREDGWALYGFDRPAERTVFQRLLLASGFGPKLAMALLSTLGPDRTVRSIQQRDVAALSTVNGIGRKKAERLVLELRDRFQDLAAEPQPAPLSTGEEAVSALVRLGYAPGVAEDAVREIVANGGGDTASMIRQALQALADRK